MSIKKISSLAQVNLVFREDQRRTMAVFDQRWADATGKMFDLAEFTIERSNRIMWRGHRGNLRAPADAPPLMFEEVHGNELELGVRANGSTDDAFKILEAFWDHFGRLVGEPPIELGSVTTDKDYTTSTVVAAPHGYAHYLKPLGRAAQEMKRRLGRRLVDAPETYLFQINVKTAAGGLTLDRAFKMENRLTTPSGDGVYFFQSPLPSAEHDALVEAFFE